MTRPPQPMRIRSHNHTRVVDDLRLAIDCLPVRTREAMLHALSSNERIIVGAYVDSNGGVCPMLAAHRCGGRTDFLSFAKSWDRFTKATRPGRPATRREIAILAGQLEASLLDESRVDFGQAISEHRQLRSKWERARTADPTGEIRARRKHAPGWLKKRQVPAGINR